MAAAAGLSPKRVLVTPVRRSHVRRMAVRCAVVQGERRTTVRSKEGDALEVCRVVNGMWQVSGPSWGRYEPAAAVDAMLRYADGGLSTFDMADICKEARTICFSSPLPRISGR
uniref:NADP-dependent oxidoreductase domain-containing protein n=1 Tax=Oryza brachyantha TaxID=4533 RepID=J3N091_ORYBR